MRWPCSLRSRSRTLLAPGPREVEQWPSRDRHPSPVRPFSARLALQPRLVISSISGGANSLWLTEWLSEVVDLSPGMRVLDLGCGRAASSIFLRREFGVQVWAADLWFSAAENLQRIRRRRRRGRRRSRSTPTRGRCRSSPILRRDRVHRLVPVLRHRRSLPGLSRPLRQAGRRRSASPGPGMLQEIDGAVPEHLRLVGPAMWALHSPQWWRRHWEKTGIVAVERPTRCRTAGGAGSTGST